MVYLTRICWMFIFIPVLVSAQQDSILSGKYLWVEPMQQAGKHLRTAILFQGKVVDFTFLQMSANVLQSPKKVKQQVPGNLEELILVKSGSIKLMMKDSTFIIGPGSVALLMPGEQFSFQTVGENACSFYSMKYRSRAPEDASRANSAGGSMVRDWNAVTFKPHDRGGVRSYFERPTAMCKRFEMHITTLNAGLKSHDPHTHRPEEIVLVINNKTEMQIGDHFYKGDAGDIYYLGSNIPHAIRNDDSAPCTYFAFQFN